MQAAGSLPHHASVQQIVTAVATTAQGRTRCSPPGVASVSAETSNLLQPENSCTVAPSPDTVVAATPEKAKRGKCMSRRSQVGSIEVSGKWYVVRFWKDVPGQEKRIHACERICPTEGAGALTKAQRKRMAFDIVMSSGVNDPHRFSETTVGITFREQSERFMFQSAARKRRPVKPATLMGWRSYLNNWLNLSLGDFRLADVNNASMKSLVARMQQEEMSAKMITNCVGLAKLVVGSAVDEDGEELFPRKWNHEFMDLPVVQAQRQPAFTSDVVTKIVQAATGQRRVLYALLAGGAMRIGEVFGLELRHISDDCRTVTVEQSCWNGKVQGPKTVNAYRQVDLCPSLAAFLKQFIGERREGLLFATRTGKPLHQSNLLRRSLHPILKAIGVERTGFHAFRRFRTTWLRKQHVPEDIIRFWLGHASRDVTDRYSKLSEDVEFRRSVAASAGLGFELPEDPIVRSVRRNAVEAEVGVVA
jgi:integrase